MCRTPLELIQKRLWEPYHTVAVKQGTWERALNDCIHPYVHANAMREVVLTIQTTRVSRTLIYMMEGFV